MLSAICQRRRWAYGLLIGFVGVAVVPSFTSPLCDKIETERAIAKEVVKTDAFGLVFISPNSGSVFRLVPDIPINQQKIMIQIWPVNGVNLQQVTLLVNGALFATGTQSLWQMTPGNYIFEAEGLNTQGHILRSTPLNIEVR